MADSWRPAEHTGISVQVPALLARFLALVAAAVLVLVVILVVQTRSLRRDLAHVSATAEAARVSKEELSSTVARQHARLLETEGELEMIRLQMEAVEMQLDGVDYLSRQVREELGLPATAGTWTEDEGEVATAADGGSPAYEPAFGVAAPEAGESAEGAGRAPEALTPADEALEPDAPSQGAGPSEAGEPPRGGAYVASKPDLQRLRTIQRRLAAAMSELYVLQDRSRRDPDAREEAVVPTVAASQVAEQFPENWPARGTVTSSYGWRLFRGLPNYHTGIDIALPYGTQVMATGTGIVVGSGWQPGYGWSVLVQHSGGYNTLYAHLSSLLSRLGDSVGPGQVIGLSGSSGNSTGPHLHYEIWQEGRAVDPRPYMDGYVVR